MASILDFDGPLENCMKIVIWILSGYDFATKKWGTKIDRGVITEQNSRNKNLALYKIDTQAKTLILPLQNSKFNLYKIDTQAKPFLPGFSICTLQNGESMIYIYIYISNKQGDD